MKNIKRTNKTYPYELQNGKGKRIAAGALPQLTKALVIPDIIESELFQRLLADTTQQFDKKRLERDLQQELYLSTEPLAEFQLLVFKFKKNSPIAEALTRLSAQPQAAKPQVTIPTEKTPPKPLSQPQVKVPQSKPQVVAMPMVKTPLLQSTTMEPKISPKNSPRSTNAGIESSYIQMLEKQIGVLQAEKNSWKTQVISLFFDPRPLKDQKIKVLKELIKLLKDLQEPAYSSSDKDSVLKLGIRKIQEHNQKALAPGRISNRTGDLLNKVASLKYSHHEIAQRFRINSVR